MTASAEGLVAAGPRPKELWLTVGLSILLHGLLLVVVILVPRFRIGAYVTVPVSYTVDLVSTTPGRQASGPAPAAAPPTPVQPPSAPAVRSAPPPKPAVPSSEELTLPGKRAPKKAPTEVEPSLRPPTVTERQPSRPVPSVTRPQPSAVPPAPAAPSPQVASVTPTPTPPAATGAAAGGGVELAGGQRGGEGTGGSALGYYLGLVDYKISTNWVPVGTGGRDTVVVIRFRVLRSGQVRDMEMETSSGDAGLDTAAMRAVRQSIPLPPFPNLLTDPFLDLRYRFVMERG